MVRPVISLSDGSRGHVLLHSVGDSNSCDFLLHCFPSLLLLCIVGGVKAQQWVPFDQQTPVLPPEKAFHIEEGVYLASE